MLLDPTFFMFFSNEIFQACLEFDDKKRPSFKEIHKNLLNHYTKFHNQVTIVPEIRIEKKLTLLNAIKAKIKNNKLLYLLSAILLLIGMVSIAFLAGIFFKFYLIEITFL